MNAIYLAIGVFLIPVAAFAGDQQLPAISSSCQIKSLPSGRDGVTVAYAWKILAKTSEDRVLSVDQVLRSPQLGIRGGTRHFEYCKPGSVHEQEIVLKVGTSPNSGERACWFEGLTADPNSDIPLPESAVVSVTTRQVNGDDESGHLIGISVSDKGRELNRHFIFIRFISPADLQQALPPELGKDEREPRDGNEWEIFTDPKGWAPAIGRWAELDK